MGQGRLRLEYSGSAGQGEQFRIGTIDLNQMALILNQFNPHNASTHGGNLQQARIRRFP